MRLSSTLGMGRPEDAPGRQTRRQRSPARVVLQAPVGGDRGEGVDVDHPAGQGGVDRASKSSTSMMAAQSTRVRTAVVHGKRCRSTTCSGRRDRTTWMPATPGDPVVRHRDGGLSPGRQLRPHSQAADPWDTAAVGPPSSTAPRRAEKPSLGDPARW